MKIEIKKIGKIGNRDSALIIVNGTPRGIIHFGKTTRTDTIPFQAFGMPTGDNTPNRFLGSFYGKNGKAAAVAAVVYQQ